MLCAGAAYEKVRPQLDLPGVDVFSMCYEGQSSKRGKKNTSSEILFLMTRQREGGLVRPSAVGCMRAPVNG